MRPSPPAFGCEPVARAEGFEGEAGGDDFERAGGHEALVSALGEQELSAHFFHEDADARSLEDRVLQDGREIGLEAGLRDSCDGNQREHYTSLTRPTYGTFLTASVKIRTLDLFL